MLEAMILSGVQTGFGDEWLRMGKLADFVVLGGNPFTVDAGKIKDIGVVRTVTGGRVMYQG